MSMSNWGGRVAVAAVGVGVGVLATVAVSKVCKWWRGGATPKTASLQDRPTRQVRQLKLYHSFPFRSSRCAWVVTELEANEHVEFIPVSLHGKEAEDLMRYRDVHPHGTLPSLVLEDGSVLLESSAICLYLAEVFLDPRGDTLLPDPDHTAEYYNFICYATSTFDQILEPLYMQLTHTPEEKRNQALVDSMMRKFNISANVISNHLSGKQYICGERFTAADCVIGYNIWWASVIQQGMLLQEFPVLLQYLERLKQRPAFEKVFKGDKPVKPSGGSL